MCLQKQIEISEFSQSFNPALAFLHFSIQSNHFTFVFLRFGKYSIICCFFICYNFWRNIFPQSTFQIFTQNLPSKIVSVCSLHLDETWQFNLLFMLHSICFILHFVISAPPNHRLLSSISFLILTWCQLCRREWKFLHFEPKLLCCFCRYFSLHPL